MSATISNEDLAGRIARNAADNCAKCPCHPRNCNGQPEGACIGTIYKWLIGGSIFTSQGQRKILEKDNTF